MIGDDDEVVNLTLRKAPGDVGDALVERVAELDEGVREDFGDAWSARTWLLVEDGALDSDAVGGHVDLAAAERICVGIGCGPKALRLQRI